MAEHSYGQKYKICDITEVKKRREFNRIIHYIDPIYMIDLLLRIYKVSDIFKEEILTLNVGRKYYLLRKFLGNLSIEELYEMFIKRYKIVEERVIIVFYIKYINKICISETRVIDNNVSSYVRSKIKDKKNRYLILSLIYSLFETFKNMRIRGGFVRDMFSSEEDIKKIDLDIYIELEELDNMVGYLTPQSSKYLNYIYLKIDGIINILSNIIYNKTINLEEISRYNIGSYEYNYSDCITLKYVLEDGFKISIDVNYIGKYTFCKNTNAVNYNIDYEQNGMELLYKNNKIVYSMFREYKDTTEYIKERLSREISSKNIIRMFINNNEINDGILLIIRDYIGAKEMHMLKIIYTVVKKIMYPSHSLCTDMKPECIYNERVSCKCMRCHNIYKKIYNRYNKFVDSNYTVHNNICKKRYCVCRGIKNNRLIIDNNYILEIYKSKRREVSYIRFAEKYCIMNELPLSIIENYEEYEEFNNYETSIDESEDEYNKYEDKIKIKKKKMNKREYEIYCSKK